jgi:RES domain-containing protein
MVAALRTFTCSEKTTGSIWTQMAGRDDRSRCCERCFKDPVLQEAIAEEGEKGDCPVCGSKNVMTVGWSTLTPYFESFVEGHTTASSFGSGDFLWALLGEWDVYGPGLDGRPDAQKKVVVGILEEGLPDDPKERYLDHPDYTDLFSPAWGGIGDLADSWELALLNKIRPPRLSPWARLKALAWTLRARIQPRRFPRWLVPGDPPDLVSFALEDLGIEYTTSERLFRARLHRAPGQATRFEKDDLRAPPPTKTPAGRANARGRPVLYMAATMDTAIAEVRPWKGAAVAVAEMEVVSNARVLDITAVPQVSSPFQGNLKWTFEGRALFERFAEELARPVSPADEDRDYLPSQHICDAIRRAGYDGILYPSAMHRDGKNVVLFDPHAAEPKAIAYVRVQDVRHDSRPMTATEPVKDSLWLG